MTGLVLLLASAAAIQDAGGQDYAAVSRELGLARADGMMREGRFLEAAVAYRNTILLTPQRPEVRLPFALALLANGNLDYAGKEIRVARVLFAGFDGFRIDAARLFGSREAWVDRLRGIDARAISADGWAALVYAWYVGGDRAESRKALARYVAEKGRDDFARGMEAMLDRKPGSHGGNASPGEVKKGEVKAKPDAAVEKPKPVPRPVVVRAGAPKRAPIEVLRRAMEILPEIFER